MARHLPLFILPLCSILATLTCDATPRFLARSWQSEDGLPGNVVRAVAQSADGYLWVGTAEGIVRFDGQRFTPVRAGAEAKLGLPSMRALFPLANGDVWVTTTGGALLRGQGAQLEQIPLPPSPEQSPAIPVSQVVLGEKEEVFIVRGTEVWEIDRQSGARLAKRTAALEKLLQQDPSAGPDRGRPVQGESGVRLRCTYGEWRFTSAAGLTLTDASGRTESITLQPEAPSGASAMMEDREGNLWLGTNSQGLWRLRPARVDVLTTADGLSERTPMLVFEDSIGGLWSAPRVGGLDYLSSGSVKHFEISGGGTERPVSALLETRAGLLWVATRDAQVYSRKKDKFSPAFPKANAPGKVLAMVEDERGEIWFGGRYGLSIWSESKPRRTIDFGTREVVRALISTRSVIWAGTESGRLFRGSGERFEAVAGTDAFAQQPITSLLPDADGALWVGTMGAGLFHVREGRVLALAPRMGGVDPRVTCMLDDGAGFLWIGTLGGICRAEKARLLGPASTAASATLVLDRSDGLLTRECTHGGQPSGWRGRDGTLYFSTGNGIARVHPERLSLNTVPPPVLIEEASGNGLPLAQGANQVKAGPGRTRLEFRYTALTFTAPEKVRFRTQLEGLDETWHDASGQRTIAYEAVPPGSYRFRVMAENGDGVWNEPGAALAVEVLPHFWETRWFQAGVALLGASAALAVGALITRARMRGRLLRLEAQTSREKERARIAQDLHDDLGASLTEISLLANLAAEERRPDSRQDDTFPEVAAKAQAAVAALDEIVWAVNPRHDTLRSLVEYLAAFGGRFLDRAGIVLRRDLPHTLPDAPLDAERRHNIFLTVREALNNAVKHSGANEVWLRARLDDGALKVSIEDNGRGFSTEADELSEGLRGMRKRMERIGGSCQLESDSTGTRLRLSLPLGPGTLRA